MATQTRRPQPQDVRGANGVANLKATDQQKHNGGNDNDDDSNEMTTVAKWTAM